MASNTSIVHGPRPLPVTVLIDDQILTHPTNDVMRRGNGMPRVATLDDPALKYFAYGLSR
jgi:hypothetical protein